MKQKKTKPSNKVPKPKASGQPQTPSKAIANGQEDGPGRKRVIKRRDPEGNRIHYHFEGPRLRAALIMPAKPSRGVSMNYGKDKKGRLTLLSISHFEVDPVSRQRIHIKTVKPGDAD
jgi:hypothetical protein